MYVGADDLDDRTLIERFKKTRDPVWFESLFMRYARDVYALCRKLIGDQALAEDLTQETFMRAYTRIEQFNERNPDSRFKAWLCVIARNLCFREYRRIKVREDYEKTVRQQGPHHSHNPQQLIVLLESELRKLDEEHQRAWLMFHVEGYSYAEIARALGCTTRRVESLLNTARERLEKLVI